MRLDDPRHGTYAGAIRHWKEGETPCEPCGAFARAEGKRQRLDRERGNPRTVPLGKRAWTIVHTVPRNQLAAQTGIAHDKLLRYDQRGPRYVIQRRTRDRLLQGETRWTAIGIQRRLQALSCIGWSMKEVAERAERDLDGLKRLRTRNRLVFVRMEIAEAVIKVYDELHMQVPPPGRSVTKTIRLAFAHDDWAPPLAWDDIDDPYEKPKGVRGRHALSQREIEAEVYRERIALLEDLAERGGTLFDAYRTLGIGRDALWKWCDRRDLLDLYNQLGKRTRTSNNHHTREREGAA